ncbi:hypothetical protein PAXINDRAFT_13135 [Paxillus involutus ATCC 200175]|uniref:RING-type domain-containing protein n=1 Tax=Paxillus involutus ATCC 200175 TaxID=664439 RepID=A0A0C9SWP6_PAXIN|nr:hypothetical protein PAXINDRAFT_13135 [Paxillus involutus ATCC 200175]
MTSRATPSTSFQDLHRQKTELTSYTQTTFHCGIYFEEQPEDDAATVDDCSHTMCRSCLRDFVCSKIQEHRLPILCPICTAVDKKPKPAVISRFLVEQISITEEQFQVWTEMDLAEVSVFIQCRECSGFAFVEDLEETMVIMYPEQDCYHVWCKECQQTIDLDGPEHSCDGSSELDNLLKEQGWKYCPSTYLLHFRI